MAISKNYRAAVIIILSVCCFSVFAGIDQIQPVPQQFASLNANFSAGQKFVPSQGDIAAVSVYLRAPGTAGDIQLSIRREWHGEIMSSEKISSDVIPRPSGWVTFRFDQPLVVKVGEPLYFRLDCSLPASANCAVAFGKDYFFDMYAQGAMTTCWMRGKPKEIDSTDLAFKVLSGTSAEKAVAAAQPKEFFINIDYSDNFNLDWAGPNGFGGARKLTPQEEIRETMRHLKSLGVDGVLWRVHALGELYHTKIGTVFTKERSGSRFDDKMIEALKVCDPLAEAVKYGREFGIKVYAWTLLNDDGRTPEKVSDFLKKYPQFQWCSRDGKYLSGVSCYAYPEVRAHRLALMDELMGYGVDGIFMSTRSHTTGFGDKVLLEYGFNQPVADAFRSRYGTDILKDFNAERDGEKLIKLRAGLMNDFYREVKALRDRKYPSVKIAADLTHLPQDWPAWANEKLVDYLMVNSVSGNYGIIPADEEYRDIADFYADAARPVKVMMWIQLVNYKQRVMHSKDELYRDILFLGRSNAAGGVLHEHCNMIKSPDDFDPYIVRALKESWGRNK